MVRQIVQVEIVRAKQFCLSVTSNQSPVVCPGRFTYQHPGLYRCGDCKSIGEYNARGKNGGHDTFILKPRLYVLFLIDSSYGHGAKIYRYIHLARLLVEPLQVAAADKLTDQLSKLVISRKEAGLLLGKPGKMGTLRA